MSHDNFSKNGNLSEEQTIVGSSFAKYLDGKILLGAVEYADLPGLHLFNVQVRVDTGANNSSLHVENIEYEERDNETWVSFDLPKDVFPDRRTSRRSAKLIDKRLVKTNNEAKEKRCLIEASVCIGKSHWTIPITLTDRSNMRYPMLLGRTAMAGRALVDPESEYIQSEDRMSVNYE